MGKLNGLDLKAVWDWLNGKKTAFGMACLFVYGGLTYLGYDYPLLKEIGYAVGGVGLLHWGVKQYTE